MIMHLSEWVALGLLLSGLIAIATLRDNLKLRYRKEYVMAKKNMKTVAKKPVKKTKKAY